MHEEQALWTANGVFVAGVVVCLANKYGDTTFYCWLDEIRYMFANFYVFYLLMVVFNFVLLALIHLNIKQRVARCERALRVVACYCSPNANAVGATIWACRHDTVEADTSSMLIRRKLLLHIVVFIAHRTPMMIYRGKLTGPCSVVVVVVGGTKVTCAFCTKCLKLEGCTTST